MTWGAKRQLMYLGFLGGVLALVVFLIALPHIHTAPSCFDNKQNGDEHGVDCSGSCTLVCSFEVAPVKVFWARAFPVTKNVYNAVAYIENQNADAGIASLSYEFRLYDKDNVFIVRKEGKTFIGPAGASAIFEGGIAVGNAVPEHTTFKILDENPVWSRLPKDSATPKVAVRNVALSSGTLSSLAGTAFNLSPVDSIRDLDLVAILYDANDNAVNASKTYVNILPAGGSKDISFTWPTALGGTVVRNEIIPLVNVFSQ